MLRTMSNPKEDVNQNIAGFSTIEALRSSLNETWSAISAAKTEQEKRDLRQKYQKIYQTLQIQEAIVFE